MTAHTTERLLERLLTLVRYLIIPDHCGCGNSECDRDKTLRSSAMLIAECEQAHAAHAAERALPGDNSREGFVTVARNDLLTVLDGGLEAAQLALSLTGGSIDFVEQRGGADSEDDMDVIAYHLYYTLPAAARLREIVAPEEMPIAEPLPAADDRVYAHVALPGMVVAPRVVAWKFTPPCRESYWRDGAPDKYDRERAINMGCTIELAYSAPANAKAGDVLPWDVPALDGWSIVGMNHYHIGGVRSLFVAMTRDGECIQAEGQRDAEVFAKLAALAHPVAAQEGG